MGSDEIKAGDLRLSLLNVLLIVDRYRPTLGAAGLKTPLLMRVECPVMDERAVDSILVTSPRGQFILVPNKGRPEIATACIPCTPIQEDALLSGLIEFMIKTSLARDWGNYAEISDFNASNLDAAFQFLEGYELPPYSIFLGRDAFKKLRPSLTPPKGFTRCPYLKELIYKSDPLGFYREVPVFLLPEKQRDICMVNATPDCVGCMTRIGDHISLVLHNLIRSTAIYRLL